MSSFICSCKHFNSIEKSLKQLTNNRDFYFPYSFKNKFPNLYDRKKAYGVENAETEITAVITTLRELNVLCVSLQYKHHYTGTLDEEIKLQTQIAKDETIDFNYLSARQLYMALKCVRYQIELEHLKELRNLTPEEDNAMFFIKEMINELAHHIIDKLPEDKTVKWSID